ncbi:MAG: asparagine--tRNA ligase [Deltaproteobacteria bacterium]|nr:asparagine--tRNA ligase [Deltaproteobacteria bacterium]
MGKTLRIAQVFRQERALLGKAVSVQGWVRTRRDSKVGVSFVELNDGSCLRNLQVVVATDQPDLALLLPRISNGCSLLVEGTLTASPGREQSVELLATRIHVYGEANPATYPLQKKRHSFEYLRQIGHLRPRTNTLGAVARVRNRLSFAIHQFFQEREFLYIQTPIITASDCEGAGEVFRVTTLKPEDMAGGDGENIYRKDFFGKPTYLTVSGQLQAEIYALALGNVYTFGPTFRSENSNTSRHLAEFWMVEPEMAFCDLDGDLQTAEALIKAMVQVVFSDCAEDLAFFNRFIEPSLAGELQKTLSEPMEVLPYEEAVRILQNSGEAFQFPVSWGSDLQAEHERYLTEKLFKRAVALIHFPRAIKPFYMRVNDDEQTVAAMDILVPRIGEIIGGSQREERLDHLLDQMRLKGIGEEDYRWYIELRQYGSVPHSGFGLGLERLVQYLTGVGNIREAIPFPRTPGHADF